VILNLNNLLIAPLYRVFWEYRRRLFLLAAISFGNALVESATLASLIPLISAVASFGDNVIHGRVPIVGWSISLSAEQLFLICTTAVFTRTCFQLLESYVSGKVITNYEASQRATLISRFLDASWSVQAEERAGRLLNLMTENIPRGRASMQATTQILVAACNFAVLVLVACLVDPMAALSASVVTGVLFFLLSPLSRAARRQANEKAGLNVDFAAQVTQVVRLAKEIRVFNSIQAVKKSLLRIIEKVRRGRFISQFLALSVPVAYQNSAALIVIGGLAANYYFQFSSPTKMGMIAILLIRALTYSQAMQTNFHMLVENLPYLDQIEVIQRIYVSAKTTAKGLPLNYVESIVFENVGFAYKKGVPVLQRIDFEVQRGEVIGVVGPSGSGKSTLVELLLRLRDPDEGCILINGTPAQAFSLSDWFHAFSYVSQDAQLLTNSVYENIRFFREDVTRDMVEHAAVRAGIHELILTMPESYDTFAGERAASFSGGQRQRICIARALAGNPEVIILDEPTSALDVHSEVIIQDTIRQLRGTATVFIIAHRLSTLNVCDRILVLRSGMVEAFAPNAELSLSNSYFSEALKLSTTEGR